MTKDGEKTPSVDAVIPVYRPGKEFPELLRMLKAQEHPVRKIILMVTLSEGEALPDTVDREGTEIHELQPEAFDHGGTRNLGASFSDADYLLFLTQDAKPEDGKLVSELLSAFSGEKTGAAYARQIAREDAGIAEKLTRSFNYPETARVQDLSTAERYGVKNYFLSNVAAMYDRKLFVRLGGFIDRTAFNEDMIYAHKLISAGYQVRYVPSAVVRHSHQYTGKEEFRRNFDLGVSQADHPEIFEAVSSEKEGVSMVKTVIRELFRAGKGHLTVPFLYRTGMKYLGYRKGKKYKKLPEKKVRKYSLNKYYWEKYYGTDQSDAL